MGEVYRARDLKLKRDVALKVLPENFAADSDRRARFQREAELLASLNHTNIAAIYGAEESGNTRCLVLELVEGPTLADRLQRGPLPLNDAIEIGRQIIDALDAAHEKGIAHRDLKPANIKLTPEGKVKVLDFGLARIFAEITPEGDPSNSLTMMSGTMGGVILGTAAYMSPEQARGKTVDRRTDIWAFGCVLYEMVTGKQAFAGETVSDIVAAVLGREPDWDALTQVSPPAFSRLVRRCLEKDLKRRLHDIADARFDLEDQVPSVPSAASRAPRILQSWTVAASITLIVLALWLWPRADESGGRRTAHLQIVLPLGIHLAVDTEHPVLAVSPDGSQLVFVGEERGVRRLYRRPLDRQDAQPIAGTEGAASPFFSPDGTWIGFFERNTLKKVPSQGGVPVPVHVAIGVSVNRGATWSRNETLIFAGSTNSGLMAGSATGERLRPIDEWKALTKLTEPYAWPSALPGGESVLFTDNSAGRLEDARVALLSLGNGVVKSLLNSGTNPRYSPSGYIFFARGGAIFAAPFDPSRSEVTGTEFKVTDGAMIHQNGAAQFAIGGSTLAYVAGTARAKEQELVWVDRQGRAETLLDSRTTFDGPRLSPDGTQLSVASFEGPNLDVWRFDLLRRTLTRVTEHPGEDFDAVWSPDGKRFALASEIGEDSSEGGPGLAWTTGSSDRFELLIRSPGIGNWDFPTSWSPDGKWIAFKAERGATESDILLLPTTGARVPVPFLQTPARETGGMFSPGGHWIAYRSDQSGRDEIYVLPFPGPGEPLLISTNGGKEAVWSRDGRELFYRESDRLMRVRIEAGASLSASRPEPLFEDRFERTPFGAEDANYDVSLDGRRFVMVRTKNPVTPTVIQVVLGYPALLQPVASPSK